MRLRSALLAAHGYPTLAVAYFRAPGLPRDLAAIPLEYFRKALTILRAQPSVDPDHVLVTGVSWGGEGSLLVAAAYPDLVNGVIAEVPNSYVDVAPLTKKKSSWTVHGKELPFAPSSQFGAPAAEVDPSRRCCVSPVQTRFGLAAAVQIARASSVNATISRRKGETSTASS